MRGQAAPTMTEELFQVLSMTVVNQIRFDQLKPLPLDLNKIVGRGPRILIQIVRWDTWILIKIVRVNPWILIKIVRGGSGFELKLQGGTLAS